ncbi:hypothetical protein OHB41_46265 [Streptomyces sp. NBC_01571]|uniref:hypothetical protein n=1 Tax=Streptomyces sp. NBC_01571 TaxID=2975883 RepID=UPI0022570748|nr:hypothetical protein [Streptomyces sp. NBC_01571]MCX4580440.1 hypothetical protein [Streptomyces sp. NBC_01571]
MTFPQAPALPEELDKLMRRMRLPYMRNAAPGVLATARAQRWDPAEVLRLLISEEVTGRDAATMHLRRRSANFPTGKTFASLRAEDSTILIATWSIHNIRTWSTSSVSGPKRKAGCPQLPRNSPSGTRPCPRS